MRHWLVKQEPGDYPFAQLFADGSTVWTGVRNFQARNYLREMKRGDAVFYYHSGGERAIVGLAEVRREAFPDPTATAGDWSAVELVARAALPRPVPLAAVKADPRFAGLALVSHARLSVLPVSPGHAAALLRLGAGEEAGD